VLCNKILDGLINLLAALTAAIDDILRDILDLKAGDLALIVTLILNVIPQPNARPGKGVLIDLAAVADSPAHFTGLQSAELAILIFCNIDNNIMCMLLRIQGTAVIMMVLCINEISGKSRFIRHCVIAGPDTDSGQLFQFGHTEIHRFPMGLYQSFIEKRHD